MKKELNQRVVKVGERRNLKVGKKNSKKMYQSFAGSRV
jgi:hypothetical protein